MKQKLLISLILLLACITLNAQQRDTENDDTTTRKEALMKEIRDYKHKVLARELSLTNEQQREFFPLYDEMEDRTEQLNYETRELERKITDSDEEVTDLEYEKATEALFDLKIKEGEIEKSYLEKFSDVLSKKQLFLLKNAERNFNRELLQYQVRLRKGRR